MKPSIWILGLGGCLLSLRLERLGTDTPTFCRCLSSTPQTFLFFFHSTLPLPPPHLPFSLPSPHLVFAVLFAYSLLATASFHVCPGLFFPSLSSCTHRCISPHYIGFPEARPFPSLPVSHPNLTLRRNPLILGQYSVLSHDLRSRPYPHFGCPFRLVPPYCSQKYICLTISTLCCTHASPARP